MSAIGRQPQHDAPAGISIAPQRCLEEEPELVNVTEEQQVRCFYPRKEERRANLK